jgi:arylsulfatase
MFDVLVGRFEHVIVLSDHGELLGEHGKWGHGYGLEPEVTRIPLHIYSGESSTETVSKSVSIIDLYQTVLDMADGIDAKEYEQRGESLIGDTTDRALLTEYHGLTHTHSVENLIGQGHPREVVEKYNQTLRGVVLPPDYYGHETMDEFSDYGDPETDNPQEAIADIGDSLEDPSTRDENDLSDGMVSQLSDLGYI